MMRRLVPVLAIVAVMPLGERSALAQVAYSGSVYAVTSEADTGDRTQSWYIVNSVDGAIGPVRLTALLPILSQELSFVDFTDPLVPVTQSLRLSGVGDPVFRVDLELTRPAPGRVGVQVGAAVKAPMRSAESGLGSGRADYAFGATVSGAVGRNTWLVDTTYWVLGDTADLPLENTPAIYAGYGRILDSDYQWSLIAAASSSPSIIAGLPASTQLHVTVLRLIRARGGLGVTVSVGLTDSAPDLSIGTSWRVGF